jgi:hypothetical protein
MVSKQQKMELSWMQALAEQIRAEAQATRVVKVGNREYTVTHEPKKAER